MTVQWLTAFPCFALLIFSRAAFYITFWSGHLFGRVGFVSMPDTLGVHDLAP